MGECKSAAVAAAAPPQQQLLVLKSILAKEEEVPIILQPINAKVKRSGQKQKQDNDIPARRGHDQIDDNDCCSEADYEAQSLALPATLKQRNLPNEQQCGDDQGLI